MTVSWQGWKDPGQSDGPSLRGPWVELSQVIYDGMPCFPSFAPPRVTRLKKIPQDPLNVTEIQMVCHVSTHVDAPCHFVADGPSMEQIPLDRLHGSGVVWNLKTGPYGLIEPTRLEEMKPSVEVGDIVILNTGWSEYFGTELYDRNYSLSPEAAWWLVNHGVKLVGVDCSTVDLAHDRRPAGFDWPVHRILLSNGVLISEHLTNLSSLSGKRVEAMFMPLRIRGADGAPARVIARAL